MKQKKREALVFPKCKTEGCSKDAIAIRREVTKSKDEIVVAACEDHWPPPGFGTIELPTSLADVLPVSLDEPPAFASKRRG